jgi:hypothetical protein
MLSTVVQGPSLSPLKTSPLNATMLRWLQNCGNWNCVLDLLVRQDASPFDYSSGSPIKFQLYCLPGPLRSTRPNNMLPTPFLVAGHYRRSQKPLL